jgi:hypothetical protein
MQTRRSVRLLISVGAIAIGGTCGGAALAAENPNDTGVFQAVCSFSHAGNDDPIVYPREAGAAHLHHFFGSRTTDAFSTLRSIAASPTTCVRHNAPHRSADRSAYWVPALYVHDRVVRASQMSAYYKVARRASWSIRPFPRGLKVLAGSPSGADDAPRHRVSAYLCMGGVVRRTPGGADLCRTSLELVIRFPDCWDGARLDSPDHRSHMAYSKSTDGRFFRCPRSHPVAVPQLELALRYPTTAGPTTRLSSGSISTIHADFMNGWAPAEQARLVRDCLNVNEYCGGGDRPVEGH